MLPLLTQLFDRHYTYISPEFSPFFVQKTKTSLYQNQNNLHFSDFLTQKWITVESDLTEDHELLSPFRI